MEGSEGPVADARAEQRSATARNMSSANAPHRGGQYCAPIWNAPVTVDERPALPGFQRMKAMAKHRTRTSSSNDRSPWTSLETLHGKRTSVFSARCRLMGEGR